MLDLDALRPERPRPLRRVEYEQLVEAGVFEDERLELLHGVLVTMSPQGDAHASVTSEITERLIEQLVLLGLREQFTVRGHSPYAASDTSEPEPDVAVVPKLMPGEPHPQRAHLIVEVSASSLRNDRRIKAGIYADAAVPEYWIVDIDGGAVEVYTDPDGDTYRAMRRLSRGDTLRPIELPGVAIAVAAILPPV